MIDEKNKLKRLIVTLADENYIEQAKQLFSSIYFNSGWSGDYMLLSHNVPEKELEWFRRKGILIRECRPFYHKKLSYHPITLLSKLYLFTPEFKKWDKILFLDGDIIVRGSLDELTTIRSFGAAGIMDVPYLKGQFYNYCNKQFLDLRSKLDLTVPPFNTGVLAISTNIIKEDTLDDFREIINKYEAIIHLSDETILNLYFYKKWEKISAVYNMCPNWEMGHRKCTTEELKGIVLHAYSCFPFPYRELRDAKSPFHNEWMENYLKFDLIDIKKPLTAKKTLSKDQAKIDDDYLWSLQKKDPFAIQKTLLRHPDLLLYDHNLRKVRSFLIKTFPRINKIISMMKRKNAEIDLAYTKAQA